MEKNYYPLGNAEDNRFIRILRIIFGTACFVMAIWWFNFNIHSQKTDWSLWITISFLSGFGFYQIWAGLGRAMRFIIIRKESITVKKNAILSPVMIHAAETSRIEIYPLSVYFLEKTGKKFLLRFGTVNYETNEKIIDEIVRFAEENNIPYEVKEEEI